MRQRYLTLMLVMGLCLASACKNDGGYKCRGVECISFTQGPVKPGFDPQNCAFDGGDIYNGKMITMLNKSEDQTLRVGFQQYAAPINQGSYEVGALDYKTLPPRSGRPISCLIGPMADAGVGPLFEFTYSAVCASMSTTADCAPATPQVVKAALIRADEATLKATRPTDKAKAAGAEVMCLSACEAAQPFCRRVPVKYAGGFDRYATLLETLGNDGLYPISQATLLQALHLDATGGACTRQPITLLGGTVASQGESCLVQAADSQGISADIIVPAFLELARARERDGVLQLTTTPRSGAPRLRFSSVPIDHVWGGDIREVIASNDSATLKVLTSAGSTKCIQFYRTK